MDVDINETTPSKDSSSLIQNQNSNIEGNFSNDVNRELKLKELIKLADQGDPGAQNEIGTYYYEGSNGFQKSISIAFNYFKKAANQGSIEAKYNVGLLCLDLADYKISDEAIKYFSQAAEMGDAPAQYMMGMINGEFAERAEQCNQLEDKNTYLQKMVKFCEASALQDYPPALYRLGMLYKNGIIVEKNLTKSAELINKAATLDDIDAQFELGMTHYESEDYRTAYRWWRKAAERGHVGAQTNLGLLFAEGLGVKQDITEAIKWYKLASDQKDSVAQYEIGLIYYFERAIPSDGKSAKEEALKWFRLSADQGYAPALYSLGVMYSDGECVEQNDEKAFNYYKQSANKNYAPAQNNLGIMYKEGIWVQTDPKMAFMWFKKAAMQGNPLSQFNLGQMFFFGVGVKQNYSESLKWIMEARKQDLSEADIFFNTHKDVFENIHANQ